MNNFVKKWLVALKSGQYKQTTGTLKDSDGYCCLGVACEISNLGKWDQEGRYIIGDNLIVGRIMSDDPVGSKISISELMIQRCVAMNDSGRTFDYIANEIEGWYNDNQ